MADNETAELRAEINRLHKMIDVLLDANGQLKQVLSFYQQTVSVPESFSSSIHRKADEGENVSCPVGLQAYGVINVSNDVAFSANGVKNVLDDTPLKNNGVKNVSKDVSFQPDGVNTVESLVAFPENGVKKVQGLVRQPENGVNNAQKAVAGSVSSTENSQSRTAAVVGEEKPVRYQYLLELLREANKKAHWGGLSNTAYILMRLHKSPKQSIKDLQRLTGLSEDGMVKRIMSLKKFGLVVRGQKRQLLLTPKAIALLEKSRG